MEKGAILTSFIHLVFIFAVFPNGSYLEAADLGKTTQCTIW